MKRKTVRGRHTVIPLLSVVLLFLLAHPAPAFAHTLHAVLLRSDPPNGSVLQAAPTVVRLWFSEPVQVVGQSIVIIDPSGKRVERGNPHVNGAELSIGVNAARTGTYQVTWQVISQDTDPAQGSLTFSVGKETAVSPGSTAEVSAPGFALQVVARWLHFVGFALSFGILAFLLLVLRPLALEQQETIKRRLWWCINLGLLALFLAEPFALLAQMVSLSGQFFDPNLLGDLLASTFGRALAQRLGAAILLWVLIGPARQGSKLSLAAALILGVALAFVDSFASHALTSRASWLEARTLALDIPALVIWAVHIVAMGLWVGGLVALLSVWRYTELNRKRDALVSRFGRVATLSLAWLVASGAVMSLLHLSQLSDLLTTSYGRTLTLKILLLPVILLLALLGARTYHHHQLRWWALEVIVLAGILILAGILVSLPPPV
jgi:copper transport protein